MWHSNVQIAVMKNNATNHSRIGCETTKVFHGRTKYKKFNVDLSLTTPITLKPNTTTTQEMDIQTKKINDNTRKHLLHSLLKNKKHYHKKVNEDKLELNVFCYIINPKTDTQNIINPRLGDAHATSD